MTKKHKLTTEEKARWAPFLHDTYNAIGPDVEPVLEECCGRSEHKRRAFIIEMTLDANRVTTFSDMTREEESVLCGLWVDKDRDTMKWLRATLNY